MFPRSKDIDPKLLFRIIQNGGEVVRRYRHEHTRSMNSVFFLLFLSLCFLSSSYPL